MIIILLNNFYFFSGLTEVEQLPNLYLTNLPKRPTNLSPIGEHELKRNINLTTI